VLQAALIREIKCSEARAEAPRYEFHVVFLGGFYSRSLVPVRHLFVITMVATREKWRHRLPHWEVIGQPHFITLRCANSLPAAARGKIAELHDSLRKVGSKSPQFTLLQRQYFLTCEKFLDGAEGFRPFADGRVCQVVLDAWTEWPVGFGWRVAHFVVMPNHLHWLMEPCRPQPQSLRKVLCHFKGATARSANALLGRTGAFWQADWFDRWMRSKAETARVVEYIRNNPVKSRLVERWQDYRWVQ
jgi:REP element-mobilizing transposase RayT